MARMASEKMAGWRRSLRSSGSLEAAVVAADSMDWR
jgi:hypothetical protein